MCKEPSGCKFIRGLPSWAKINAVHVLGGYWETIDKPYMEYSPMGRSPYLFIFRLRASFWQWDKKKQDQSSICVQAPGAKYWTAGYIDTDWPQRRLRPLDHEMKPIPWIFFEVLELGNIDLASVSLGLP